MVMFRSLVTEARNGSAIAHKRANAPQTLGDFILVSFGGIGCEQVLLRF
jgi:hypothetical protein